MVASGAARHIATLAAIKPEVICNAVSTRSQRTDTRIYEYVVESLLCTSAEWKIALPIIF